MKWIRFMHNGSAAYGALDRDGQTVRLVAGSIYERPEIGEVVGDFDELDLLPPCEPTKIIAVGRNSRAMMQEFGDERRTEPHFFYKPPSALIAHGEMIRMPVGWGEVIHEAEMAAVIGRRAKNVEPEDVAEYILGYTCVNDASAWTQVLFKSKSWDTSCATGPCVSTEVEHPNDARIRCWVNGQTRQDYTIGEDFNFLSEECVSWASRYMTLMPGDLILFGTGEGFGLIRSGDVVEIEIVGIGRLRNPVGLAKEV